MKNKVYLIRSVNYKYNFAIWNPKSIVMRKSDENLKKKGFPIIPPPPRLMDKELDATETASIPFGGGGGGLLFCVR